MPTSPARMKSLLREVSGRVVEAIADGRDVAPVIVLARDELVVAMVVAPWSSPSHKELLLSVTRVLCAQLDCDGVGIVADAFVSEPSNVAPVRPSEDPSAREGVLALGLLGDGAVLSAQFTYGRDDAGQVSFDHAPLAEGVVEVRADSSVREGLLVATFVDVVSQRAAVDLVGAQETAALLFLMGAEVHLYAPAA